MAATSRSKWPSCGAEGTVPENLDEWPSKRGTISKIRPSDGCGREEVPLAVERRCEFPEFGGYLANVGILMSANIFVTGSRLRPDNFQSELDRLEGRLS